MAAQVQPGTLVRVHLQEKPQEDRVLDLLSDKRLRFDYVDLPREKKQQIALDLGPDRC